MKIFSFVLVSTCAVCAAIGVAQIPEQEVLPYQLAETNSKKPTKAFAEFPCTLTKLLDADTGEVEVKFKFHVRFMLGNRFVDAPEKNTAQGQASWNRLREYAEGKQCMLRIPIGPSLEQMVSFGRAKGELTPLDTPKESLSEWLVRHNLAVVGTD